MNQSVQDHVAAVASTRSSAAPRRLALFALLAAWIYLCILDWENDGLWFQGDSPRHAANGLFWMDYLGARPADAQQYALRYYARYPVINPVAYPPFFYLLEGAAFRIFGANPFVAKGLVLAMAGLLGIYAVAWIGRWIGWPAGCLGAAVLLLPCTVRWSHAVMLNVPAAALSVAALYHARRWLEQSSAGLRSLHACLGLALAAASVATYFLAGVVLLIVVAWMAIMNHPNRASRKALLLMVIAGGGGLAVLAVAAAHWAPTHLSWALPSFDQTLTLATWTRYASWAPSLFGLPCLLLSLFGVAIGAASEKYRRETALLLTWAVVAYVTFSLLPAKAPRYLLPLAFPIVGLSAVALSASVDRLCRGARTQVAGGVLAGISLLLLGVQGASAAFLERDRVDGFRNIAAYMVGQPPSAMLYDGYHNGVFTLYLRSLDSDWKHRVMLGHKLLYSAALVESSDVQERVTTVAEVVDALRKNGCEWVVIENGPRERYARAARLLRDAVAGKEFEHTMSFAITAPGADRIDVYRMKLPVDQVEEIELPFPLLGPNTSYRVRPIERDD